MFLTVFFSLMDEMGEPDGSRGGGVIAIVFRIPRETPLNLKFYEFGSTYLYYSLTLRLVG